MRRVFYPKYVDVKLNFMIKLDMKKRLFILIPVIIVLLFGIGLVWIGYSREKVRRSQCLSALRSTGALLCLYRGDNEGELPPSLSLMSSYLGDPSFFLCPWGNKIPGTWADVSAWMDYFYVYWPSVKGVYANYPLMYDRRLSNHNGKGICVLLVEGAVNPPAPPRPESYHGQFFWDENAQWLRKFVREHPDLKVPLPEDLPKK